MQSKIQGAINQSLNSPNSIPKSFQINKKKEDIFQFQFSPVQIGQIIKQKHQHQTSVQQPTDQNQNKSLNNFRINSNSLVQRYQLLIIVCLIVASTASVFYSVDGTFRHIKKLNDYFNAHLLGNQNLSLYDEGDNIDQPQIQLQDFQDMQDHFINFFQVFQKFDSGDGFTIFTQEEQKNVVLEVQYIHNQKLQKQLSLSELQQFFDQQNLRDFLLSVNKMRILIKFGSNNRVKLMNLIVSYETHSYQMLRISLKLQHQPNINFISNKKDLTIRIIEQTLAFLLVCSYLHNSYKIKIQNIRLIDMNYFLPQLKRFQRHRLYWCLILAALNVIIIFNETLAPMCSFLQLLPIFQKNNSLNNQLSFTSNLRYALPIVISVLFPIFIFLNGFVLYSILTYPGTYFDSYTQGLFSYLYQNFQVGTYQIFIQLSKKGNFAYFLYAILYFYMVLVGNNLLPALFCRLIFTKVYEKDLQNHLQRTIKHAVCPKCNSQMLQTKQNNLQITINSPKISPYLKGNISADKIRKKSQQTTKLFVQVQKDQKQDSNDFIKIKSQKIRSLTQKVLTLISKTKFTSQQQKVYVQKIQKLLFTIDSQSQSQTKFNKIG